MGPIQSSINTAISTAGTAAGIGQIAKKVGISAKETNYRQGLVQELMSRTDVGKMSPAKYKKAMTMLDTQLNTMMQQRENYKAYLSKFKKGSAEYKAADAIGLAKKEANIQKFGESIEKMMTPKKKEVK